uniref:Phosphatidic acid phosphatase type 2/haloperoxidase domain-containing protein n=1 Tax=Romanomermis culicivorax TaxID=13658 RepID=A0A915HHA6_ROMCU
MISLRGAPLLRPFLIFGLLGMAMIASFSRIQGYKNHWADVWWAWVIGGLTAIYLPKVEISTKSYDEEEQPQQQNVPVEANIENGSRNRRKKDRTYEVTTTTESYQRTIHHPNGYNPDNYLHSKNVDVNY